jgi:hypothetical protein
MSILSYWLRLPVTHLPTGVKWDKWDTTKDYAKVSHFSKNKEAVMSKTEQNPHEMSDEARDNLVRFFDVLIEIDQKQKALYRRLEKEPKGFPMAGDGRNCGLCGHHVVRMLSTNGRFLALYAATTIIRNQYRTPTSP